jgi:hypothetical protein
MKLKRNKYDKLILIILSINSIFIINHANKWGEPFMYTIAITITLYSYLIAIGVLCSLTVFSVWSIIHNVRVATKLKVENLEIIKALTKIMNEISEGKPSSAIVLKY